ncbi:hypothetical protein GCM10022393_35240 [Aquimarina addita]|uniref:DUF4231 domain-containing protein n=1 Tax=Aquimarina addita TaxID=870485 RepID=A0ABP6UUJ1_9FLAO
MKEAEYFIKVIDEQIRIFDEESKKHKKLYRNIRYFVFGGTGLSTILAGIAIESGAMQRYFNIALVVITAALSVAGSYEGLRKPSELWIMERNMYHSLRDLKRAFQFEYFKNHTKMNVQPFFDQMQSILNAAGEKWQKNIHKAKAGISINRQNTMPD